MSAKDKIDRIISSWALSDTMLLNTWCLIEKKEDKTVKTLLIDTKSHPACLRYNCKFVESLSEQQLEFVLTSECLKILLRHCTSRLLNPKQISSLASSITVDDLLKKNTNFNEMDWSKVPTPDKFGLDPDRFFEEYFRKLEENSQEVEMKISKMFGKSKEGEGEGEGDPQSGDSSDKEPLQEYFDPRNGNTDRWDNNQDFDFDIKEMVNDKKTNLQNWGKVTGSLVETITAANKPKISYREIIRRFNHSIMAESLISSRMKVNRRYDLESPGYRHEYKPKLLYALDESGSMSNEDIAEGFSVINATCKHADITWMSFDTEIKQIQKDYRKAKKTFKAMGRGGTDPTCVLEYAKTKKLDGVIIFSDMEFSSNIAKPKFKVLWLATEKGRKPPVTWGMSACLNRYEGHYDK